MSRPAALRGLFALPVALLIATGPALAQPTTDPTEETVITAVNHDAGTTTKTIKVAYNDLNLADGRDYSRFTRRVTEAADTVCADNGLWNKFDAIDRAQCTRNAVASAMAQIPGGRPARD